MSLFRRVTRYRVGGTQDPRENRLTEVTAAVLERVDGLAQALFVTALGGIDESDAAAQTAEPALQALKALESPRLAVATQFTTQSLKFVDLQVRWRPQPFATGSSVLLWVEVKHGADVHGTQLSDYVTDIALESADERLVIVVAPRQTSHELTGVPSTVPVVEWQTVATAALEHARRAYTGQVERFLLNDYLTYLAEEGLMEEELLTAEHAFTLRAHPRAEAAVARVIELADAHVAKHWGPRGQAAGGKKPAYGLGYWAHYRLLPGDAEGASATWRSTVFEWGLTRDTDRDEPRNAWVFFAGATFWAARDSPEGGPENASWLDARRKDGFEYVSSWYWRLNRYRYPEELLGATTLDAQVEELGAWVVAAFSALAEAPPPH